LSFRTTKELRERLDAARAASGRSLAQEAEYRLEQSFASERGADVFDLWMRDPSLRTMAFLMIGALVRAGEEAAAKAGTSKEPQAWLHRSDTYRAACAAVVKRLGVER
jgi:hypothetical protein